MLNKKLYPFIPFFFVIFSSILIFYYVDPQDLLSIIGLQNAYLMMFVISFLGGLTTFNFVPYYSVILLLVSAGLSPFWVGLASALGVMCGDSVSYLMGYSGSKVIPENFKKIFEKISSFAKTKPKIFIALSFLYGCVSPFSNDFITISGGLARIPYTKVMVPLILGNLVFNIGFAYLSVQTFNYLKFFTF